MPYLQRVNSSDRSIFPFKQDYSVAGRSESADFSIQQHSEVSREHCGFRLNDKDEVTVIDLGSKNGTHVNGRRIYEETTLQDRDRVRLSRRVEFMYRAGKVPSDTQECFFTSPEEMTIADEVPRAAHLGKPLGPKDGEGEEKTSTEKINISDAAAEVEKELENAGFKTLMEKFAKQAKPRPKPAKKEDESHDEEYW